jgi:hypothetical protein
MHMHAGRAFVSIDINWCRDSRAVGGVGFADTNCKNSKPAVTAVGAANKAELVWMLGEPMNALKHDTGDVNVFATAGPELTAHKVAEKSARGQPSIMTPVSGDTYLANRHNQIE